MTPQNPGTPALIALVVNRQQAQASSPTRAAGPRSRKKTMNDLEDTHRTDVAPCRSLGSPVTVSNFDKTFQTRREGRLMNERS